MSASPTSSSPNVADETPAASTPIPTAVAGIWQAIWSPEHNAYYFYNAETQETTWSNPLQTPAATSTVAENALAQGIDPSLAHLDPSLASSSSALSANFTYTAKFNARTGAFAKVDARDPSHLSEFERAKRMSEFYFDVGAWEKEVEERKREEEQGDGKKKKRPTKKDLDRFKEQKRQKKIAKTAWLRT